MRRRMASDTQGLDATTPSALEAPLPQGALPPAATRHVRSERRPLVTPIANPATTPCSRTRSHEPTRTRTPHRVRTAATLAVGLAIVLAWTGPAHANQGQIIGDANRFYPDAGI